MANLTTKELSGIEDQLKGEETLIQKCKMFAENVQEEALKAKFEEIAQKHQQHYDKLYSLLG
jgi:rubrerythrin